MGFAEDWAAANAGSTRKVGETGYTGVGMSTPDGQPNASFGYLPWVIGGGSNSAPVYNSPGQRSGSPFRSGGAEFAPPAQAAPAQAAPAPMPVQPMPQAAPAAIHDGTANSRQAVVDALAGMAPQGQEPRALPTKHFPRYNFSGGYSRGSASGGGGSSLDPNMRHFLGWGGGVV